jgi:hypothetical protein
MHTFASLSLSLPPSLYKVMFRLHKETIVWLGLTTRAKALSAIRNNAFSEICMNNEFMGVMHV